MEDMIMAAQGQALRTNTIKTIDKQNVPAECRMAEKVMRQLAIWYRNAKNCPKAISMLLGRQDGADDSLGLILYVECWVMIGMTNTCIT